MISSESVFCRLDIKHVEAMYFAVETRFIEAGLNCSHDILTEEHWKVIIAERRSRECVCDYKVLKALNEISQRDITYSRSVNTAQARISVTTDFSLFYFARYRSY